MSRVITFRRILLGLVISTAGPLAPAAGEPLLQLTATIALPMVKGRIDHLDVDPKGHRLFIAALATTRWKWSTLPRAATSGAYKGSASRRVWRTCLKRVVCTSPTAVQTVSMCSMERRWPRYNASRGSTTPTMFATTRSQRTVVVGYGKGALRIVDTASGQTVGDIPLPGHPESFQLEQRGSRVFVNVPSAGKCHRRRSRQA
jgi:hypothetical protein